MKIWCISKYASLPSYGPGARLFYLAKEFSKLGYETSMITSDSNHLASFPASRKCYNFEKLDAIDVCWIKTKRYKKTASFSRVLSWFDFEWKLFKFPQRKFMKPDVVIVSSLSIFSIIYGYYLKKKFNAFLVFEIRDIWPLTMVAEGGFGQWHPLTLFIGWVEKFGYKKADLIVGTMPRLDLHINNILNNKINKPFYCSPLGFDQDTEGKDIVELTVLDKYFHSDKVTIGYAGSMGLTNALDSFVACIEKLTGNSDVEFVLVGDGALKERYEKRLAQQSNVKFVPKIPQQHVQYFLSKCDILYLSTHDSVLWQYGQSMNKMVQYMLSGKPVIASYSGYKTMLNEAGSGAFVPANAVEPLLAVILDYSSMSNSERNVIGQRGRQWILENRAYNKLASDYINKIESCLEL